MLSIIVWWITVFTGKIVAKLTMVFLDRLWSTLLKIEKTTWANLIMGDGFANQI